MNSKPKSNRYSQSTRARRNHQERLDPLAQSARAELVADMLKEAVTALHEIADDLQEDGMCMRSIYEVGLLLARANLGISDLIGYFETMHEKAWLQEEDRFSRKE